MPITREKLEPLLKAKFGNALTLYWQPSQFGWLVSLYFDLHMLGGFPGQRLGTSNYLDLETDEFEVIARLTDGVNREIAERRF